MGYRQKWERANGPIPFGHEIHHRDGNRRNHALSNLELVSPAEHIDRHRALGSLSSPARLAHLDKVRPKAAAWHASPEGRAWHREHGVKTWTARVPVQRECIRCGRPFMSVTHRENDRYCSNACKAAWRRLSGIDDESRTCAKCGRTFTANRYSKTFLCSRQCGGRPRR